MKLIKLSRPTLLRLGLSMLIGGVLGYLYYAFYGCNGSCTISSSPVNSTLYGMISGALIFGSSLSDKKKQPSEDKD